MAGWPVGRSVGRLVGWLLASRSVDWSISQLVFFVFFRRSANWLIGSVGWWLVASLIWLLLFG